ALRSVGVAGTIVLVGGYDRGLDWAPFVDFVRAQPPAAVVTLGANGAAIASRLQPVAAAVRIESADTLERALILARSGCAAGGTIRLSPGAPSFDQFKDYAERGREFARLAGFDPAAIAQIGGLGIA